MVGGSRPSSQTAAADAAGAHPQRATARHPRGRAGQAEAPPRPLASQGEWRGSNDTTQPSGASRKVDAGDGKALKASTGPPCGRRRHRRRAPLATSPPRQPPRPGVGTPRNARARHDAVTAAVDPRRCSSALPPHAAAAAPAPPSSRPAIAADASRRVCHGRRCGAGGRTRRDRRRRGGAGGGGGLGRCAAGLSAGSGGAGGSKRPMLLRGCRVGDAAALTRADSGLSWRTRGGARVAPSRTLAAVAAASTKAFGGALRY